MSQALNYCRDWVAKSDPTRYMDKVPSGFYETITEAKDIAAGAQKFVLPPGGILVEDNGLKALGDDRLHLPFADIVLEYQLPADPDFDVSAGYLELSKAILFAREYPECIVFISSQYNKPLDHWFTRLAAVLPRDGYIPFDERASEAKTALSLGSLFDDKSSDIPIPDLAKVAFSDAWVLLSFLNALACSNVEISQADNPAADRWAKLGPRKQARHLPPDVYHVLTIKPNAAAPASSAGMATGADRKPVREHLRRGHIRRLANGLRLWINAAVVMPGSTAGRVTKDYRVKP